VLARPLPSYRFGLRRRYTLDRSGPGRRERVSSTLRNTPPLKQTAVIHAAVSKEAEVLNFLLDKGDELREG